MGCDRGRADSQVFAHGPDGKLAHIPAGKPRRMRPEEVMALVETFTRGCIVLASPICTWSTS